MFCNIVLYLHSLKFYREFYLKFCIFGPFTLVFDPLAQICANLHLYRCIGITLRIIHKKFYQKIPWGSKVMSEKLKNALFYVVKSAIFELIFLTGSQIGAKIDNWAWNYRHWTKQDRKYRLNKQKQKKLWHF